MNVDRNLPSSESEIAKPEREIRARHTDKTLRVYQAYSPAIAEPAVEAQRFIPPFRMTRMTWIKPSFFWMMYRSGWAMKEGQERVLAIDITRDGFEWALGNSCLSHFDPKVHESHAQWTKLKEDASVRIQWDPERDCQLERLDYRSIQVGLSGEAAQRYVNDWIQKITDVTKEVANLRELEMQKRKEASYSITEQERPYPLRPALADRIGIVA